jgi:hypothetical protein
MNRSETQNSKTAKQPNSQTAKQSDSQTVRQHKTQPQNQQIIKNELRAAALARGKTRKILTHDHATDLTVCGHGPKTLESPCLRFVLRLPQI